MEFGLWCSDRGRGHPFLHRRYRFDHRWRRAVQYTAERGIPLSKYLGRTEGPEWTAEDRAVVAVYQAEESQRCPDCGTYPWEWEEGEEVWEADVDDCEGCRQREDLREKVSSEHSTEMIRGWKLRFFRKGTSDGE